MAKRFIDTNIFRKSFMQNISVEAKLFYIYLFCDCDHCGIWQVEFEVAKVRLGIKNLELNDVLNYFENKIVVFDYGTKWFLPQFVFFQYGELKANNKIHKSVLASLTKFNLLSILNNYDDNKAFLNPLQRVKDKDKDKAKETDKEKETETDKTSELITPIVASLNEVGNALILQEPKKLAKSRKNNEISSDYNKFVSVYSEFIKNRGLPVSISEADGKGLKSIIKYLNSIDSVKTGNKKALDLWTYILNNWDKLSQWLQTQIQLRQINSQLPNIIEHLRNGKQTNNNTSAQQLAEALRGAIQSGGSL